MKEKKHFSNRIIEQNNLHTPDSGVIYLELSDVVITTPTFTRFAMCVSLVSFSLSDFHVSKSFQTAGACPSDKRLGERIHNSPSEV